MILTYIGLGSNLNNPILQIQLAIKALKKLPHSSFLKASRLYETKPIGFLDQPNFINAVVAIRTLLTAQELLSELLFLENSFGRVRGKKRNRPRILDLDILLYGNEVINETNLVIPHPRLKERAFVLVPLYEICSDLQLPDGERIKNLLVQQELDQRERLSLNDIA